MDGFQHNKDRNPFVAECLFCHGKVRLPGHAVGMSISCPRCGCSFTVVPQEGATAEVSLPALPPSSAVHAALPAGRALPDLATSNTSAKRILSPLGVVSVCLASIALALLSLPALRPITLVLGGLALTAGVLGLAPGGDAHRGRVVFPAAGAVLAVPVLVIAAFWPNLLNPTPPAEFTAPSPDVTGPLAVPLVGEGKQPAPEWVDASTHYAQLGDLRVRVLRVTLGPVASANREVPPGADELLQISFRVYNAGTTRRLDYRSWSQPVAPGEEAVVLKDDRGQTYRLHSFGAAEAAGPVRSTSIAPLRPIEDVLVFDPPKTKVEYLRLELPAAAVGDAGTLRLHVPRSLFHGF
jgi:hypothetical protein